MLALVFRPTVVVVLILGAAACAPRTTRPPTPPPIPAPTFRVPPGCEGRIDGLFAHEARREWQYVAQDDGQTLTLKVRRGQEDTPPPGAPVRVTLQRTPDGFLGAAEGMVGADGDGQGCPVSFPTRVVGCEEHTLVVETVAEVSVNEESCELSLPPEPMPWETHTLVRLPPPDQVPEPSPQTQ